MLAPDDLGGADCSLLLAAGHGITCSRLDRSCTLAQAHKLLSLGFSRGHVAVSADLAYSKHGEEGASLRPSSHSYFAQPLQLICHGWMLLPCFKKTLDLRIIHGKGSRNANASASHSVLNTEAELQEAQQQNGPDSQKQKTSSGGCGSSSRSEVFIVALS